jgi:hypothetical protein
MVLPSPLGKKGEKPVLLDAVYGAISDVLIVNISGTTRSTGRSTGLEKLGIPDAAQIWNSSVYRTLHRSGTTRSTGRSTHREELGLPDAPQIGNNSVYWMLHRSGTTRSKALFTDGEQLRLPDPTEQASPRL